MESTLPAVDSSATRRSLRDRVAEHLSPGPLLKEAFSVSAVLFRIMIPVIIVVKILQELGAVRFFGTVLGPVMGLAGLPGSMGLVWATAMITNLYGGIVVFLSLLPEYPLTVAQVTVLTTLIIVAHALPVELGIARKTGVRLRFLAPFRIGCAFLLGCMLNVIYSLGGWLQQPSSPAWEIPAETSASLGGWALGQLQNLGMIFLIILGLMLVMRILRFLGAADTLNRLLRPVLTSMGIGEAAATITVFGLVLGISYGGGLIIRSAESGEVRPRDIFFTLTLMSICHSLAEDTLLMMSLGASMTGVLVARVAFSWVVMYSLVRLVSGLSDSVFGRLFFRFRRSSSSDGNVGTGSSI